MAKAKKDWTGNKSSTFKTMAATSHADDERELLDYYATDPDAINYLLKIENLEGPIWEPACGQGHLSIRLKEFGFDVFSSDLIDRGYGDSIKDFLCITNNEPTERNIITNPPYIYANEFIIKALSILNQGRKLALFLPIRYLEGKGRKELFRQHPPKVVCISSSRILCAKNGDFIEARKIGSAVAYGWFIWERGYSGPTILKWFN